MKKISDTQHGKSEIKLSVCEKHEWRVGEKGKTVYNLDNVVEYVNFAPAKKSIGM